MDQWLKDQALQYDLESLRRSLVKHDENIASLNEAVALQEQVIADEQLMLNTISTRPAAGANYKLIEIDSIRLTESIAGHHSEIDIFVEEVNSEKERRRDTEQMVMYLEARTER